MFYEFLFIDPIFSPGLVCMEFVTSKTIFVLIVSGTLSWIKRRGLVHVKLKYIAWIVVLILFFLFCWLMTHTIYAYLQINIAHQCLDYLSHWKEKLNSISSGSGFKWCDAVDERINQDGTLCCTSTHFCFFIPILSSASDFQLELIHHIRKFDLKNIIFWSAKWFSWMI